MKYSSTLAIILTVILTTHLPFEVFAQSTEVECGSTITGELSRVGDSRIFTILMGVGERLTILGQPQRTGQKISMVLYGPQDTFIEGAGSPNSGGYVVQQSVNIETRRLSAYGTYTITIANNSIPITPSGIGQVRTDEYYGGGSGSFTLQFNCISSNGTARSLGSSPENKPVEVSITSSIVSARSLIPLQCGSIYTSEFARQSETHSYALDMISTDQNFTVAIEPQGDYLSTLISVRSPLGTEIQGEGRFIQTPSFEVTVSDIGSYSIRVSNNGIGAYSIFISCMTADGPILPGEGMTTTTQTQPTAQPASAAAAPSVATIAAPVACPNSPQTQLFIGAEGKVTPGDANNLRDQPSGAIIGRIPAGEQFTVLAGPECGQTGLTFWQVQYGELVGWTAEGHANTYWLEPLDAGRG